MTQEEQVAGVSLEPAYYDLYADEEPQEQLIDFLQKMWLDTIENENTVYYRDEDEEEEDSEEPSFYEAYMDEPDDITIDEDEEEHPNNYAYLDDSDIDLTQEDEVAEVCPDFAFFENCADEEPENFKNCWEEIFFFSHSWLQYTEDNRVVYNRDDNNEEVGEEPSYYEAVMDEPDDIPVDEDEEDQSNYAYLDNSDIDLDNDNEEDDVESSGHETSVDEESSSHETSVDEESSGHETSVDESDNIPVRSSRPLGRWARFTRAIRGLFCCCKPRTLDDNG
ncbi:uncharacterized protein [Eleutherodactylus coqui]|uniref:uncharacterized protein isoform X2 n=1 Tax=Eleutherodactylus coqui TaxID=57060 RepID=UPI003462EE70